MLKRANTGVKGKMSVRARVAAKPVITGAKGRTPAKAREAAQRIRALDKVRRQKEEGRSHGAKWN
jgi:hypothetical protein